MDAVAESPRFERLPKNIVPTHYALILKPNLRFFTYEGKTDIEIKVISATNRIVLNASDIVIDSAQLQLNGDTYNLDVINFDAAQEIVTLPCPKELPTDATGTLTMGFSGVINNRMKGFYRSRYSGKQEGVVRYAAVTQFEATYARRCFPCWDEPDIKATFDITLLVQEHLTALSNMPVKLRETLPGGLRRISFERTPLMSTYLVAVVVGEYDYEESTTEDGVLVRVYTPLGRKEQGIFALEVATKTLPFYKRYFDIMYPLPKMDLIAIAEFPSGAMENWGLVTYRETHLLVDPVNTSLISKQSIALTVGHEMAHQWFGNLVTMEWWTDLWLNEGYATFIEYLCVDHIFPQFDIWKQFATTVYTAALELDSLENSHPIEVPVGHPREIAQIFDDISYNKSASVIRMLHDYIGEAEFRKGMHIYLERHQYENTRTEHLWAALEEASAKPVAEVMSNWIKLKGFPMVNVDSVQQLNGQRLVLLSQTKFSFDDSLRENDDDDYTWVIPITILTSRHAGKIAKSFLLDKKSKEILLNNVDLNDWVKVNAASLGYYRTCYTKSMLEQLKVAVRNSELPPLDRLGLMDDMFALVQAGKANTVEAFELMDSYRNETDYTVWLTISRCLNKLSGIISHAQELTDYFNRYCEQLYLPVADRLGWEERENEHVTDMLLRSLVLDRLVSFDCKHVIKEAQQRFGAHINGTRFIPADLRLTCYKAMLQDSNEAVYERMIQLYRSTNLHEEQGRISSALGCLRNAELLQKAIEFGLSGETRIQDSVLIILAIAANPKGRDLVWQHFKATCKTKLTAHHRGCILTTLIKHMIENFASEKMATEVETFFRSMEHPFERKVQQGLETLRVNAAWFERDIESISKYLKSRLGEIENEEVENELTERMEIGY